MELTFQPSQTLRQVEERTFCVGGPRTDPAHRRATVAGAGRPAWCDPAVGSGALQASGPLAWQEDNSCWLDLMGRRRSRLPPSTTACTGDGVSVVPGTDPAPRERHRRRATLRARAAWLGVTRRPLPRKSPLCRSSATSFRASYSRPGERISVGSLTVLSHRP